MVNEYLGGDIMEYPSKNDFFLKFKALYNEKDKFIDYILVDGSENFQNAVNHKSDSILGKRISQIVVDNENNILGLKEFYFHMIPKTGRKFELYIKELEKWYLVNMFSDEKDYLLLIYTDISKYKNTIKELSENSNKCNGELSKLEDNQKFYCYRDKLTDLYTKDFFDEELNRLNTKRQLPISIIMGDLNGLKLINDAFGHQMGDKALKKVAKIMKDNFRVEDIISRVSGDEYMILLPRTTKETALSIIDRMKNDFSKDHLDFLPLSVSFGAATKEDIVEDINEIIKRTEENMYFNKLTESKEAKLSTIQYLKEKLKEISFETDDHHERLKDTCLLLADKLNLSEIEKEELKLLSEFHDIGKIGVPQDILQKEDTLSSDEWGQMKRHSEIGYHIARSAKETLAVDELILMHHERWDGKGYPSLLKEEQLPITVRVFAIADAYEAMVNDRPYRKKLSKKEALKEINDKAGSQFDPHLAKIFVEEMGKIHFTA